ncbi:MAG: 23S rRNA (pseudouridine(1915)-N(3))-methyltransferase RlmH [Proteobacteria bacterium]|nr:23S rRNA (pseudouridine(1915)-N(3))-methyltransferase RlmH [Pseudomonadota bacterium]NDC24499.1 23S rRNA (pseudouridine(1915)-N(3))-methyltransferase RlmH [Pseudomonadota bacterium]NDD04374.1 23S rRNA (pseudouridine(1915)-N(3))-methyltransferase RlmH [Pseudomonadota bacterium]NDG27641.1 23S rRNA (pseudouridine(1915)-N(3))-methyltransferase RlmH [Pseudomonadota bacterium]
MKLEIIKIGKSKFPGISEVAHEYVKRLKPMVSVDAQIWKENSAEQKVKSLFSSDAKVVILDELGAQWSSKQLSKKLKTWSDHPGIKRVSFVIGGPYGHSEETKRQADELWSLSSCTFPSELAWLLVCEQIYRGFTILKGMSYHHD